MTSLGAIHRSLDRIVTAHPDALALAALAVSFPLRLHEAATTYLNPDEANYFRMSIPNGLRDLYHSALGTHHPALYIMLMHLVGKLSVEELMLRAVALIAGMLFPWFLYRWLSLVWNRLAGLVALLLVTFAPHLILLSAQARSYTLAYLGIFAFLYCQERALRASSARWMLLATAPLCMAIFSEYFVAYFAGAAGLAFLIRAWKQPPSAPLWTAWAAGQACGIALYVFLFFSQIQPLLSSGKGEVESQAWLIPAFPQPGENLVLFLGRAVVKQFAYIFASIPLGIAMMLAFLAGVWFLWTAKAPIQRIPARLLVLLTTTMFVLAAAGSIARFHPLARTRHTAVLGIFAATIVAIAFERVFRSRPGLLLPAALLLLPVWWLTATPDQHNIPVDRHQRGPMLAAIARVRQEIPAGAPVLMSFNTRIEVDYYLHSRQIPFEARDRRVPEWITNDYRLVSYSDSYPSPAKLFADLQRFRAEYGVPPGDPVWFLDGGWDPFDYHHVPQAQTYAGNMEDFSGSLLVARLPPEYLAGSAR